MCSQFVKTPAEIVLGHWVRPGKPEAYVDLNKPVLGLGQELSFCCYHCCGFMGSSAMDGNALYPFISFSCEGHFVTLVHC